MMIWSYKANNVYLVEPCSVPPDFQKQPFHKSPIHLLLFLFTIIEILIRILQQYQASHDARDEL